MKTFIHNFIIVLVICSALFTAEAQVQEDLTPAEKKQLTRVTEPITMFKGFFRVDITTQFFSNDKSFDDNGKKTLPYQNLSRQGQSLSMSMYYGISDRLEITAILPYYKRNTFQEGILIIPYQGINRNNRIKINSSGMADIGIGINYQLIKAKGTSPALTLFAMGFLPVSSPDISNVTNDGTGNLSYTEPVTTGEYSILTAVRMKKITYPLSYELEIGFRKSFGSTRIIVPNEAPSDFQSGNEYYVRPFVNFHLNKWVLLTNYVDYLFQSADNYQGGTTAYQRKADTQFFRYYPGISFQLGKFRLEQSVMIPLFGKNAGADPSYLFSIARVF